ncbi:AAA family ATPase [Aeromonas hydrophila]|uniref:AAA family ATPase n=1 Tax=Aeromonas hydrophila TaxID=644 RepID=UPI003EC6BC51
MDGLKINLQCSVEKACQPGGEVRLAVMAGESIYANVRLRLTANRTRENLALGSIVITDSVNPIPLTRDAYHDIALSVGVPCLDVEVVCSNPKLHRERVENRTVDIEGLALPDWQAVINRDYQPWDRKRLVLDSATLSVTQSVEAIVAALAKPL